MGALHKVKAYFGMVPVDELDEYDDEYDDAPRGRYDRERPYGGPPDRDGYDRGFAAPMGDDRALPPPPRAPRVTGRQAFAGAAPPVRGALAVQPDYEPQAVSQVATERAEHPLSRITTLHPRSYAEARAIGEHYRDGTPVIMNLTELDDADARRLVDFAAGLAFAMRGAMDKVTNKVFLISPPDVDVTAEERKRLAEGGFLGRG